MTASVDRSMRIVVALLLAAGAMLLQALIGGRVLLFAFPGYAVIGIAALVGVVTIHRSRTRPDGFCLVASGLFFGYIIARALWSPAYFARPDLFSVMAALIAYGLTATVLTSSTVRTLLFAALLVFSLPHVLVGVVQFTHGDNFMLLPFLQRADYGQRASGFYVCPNHLAGLLEVLGIFGLSLSYWSRWPIWGKLLTLYATAVCYVGVALSGSRGGYLSTIASLAVFGLLSVMILRSARPTKWRRFAWIGFLMLGALLLAATVMIQQSEFLGDRADRIISNDNVRIGLWRAALQQWQLQPVIGTGSGTYRFYGREFRTPQMQHDPIDVHNDYLHLLCEYGLVGAAGFLLFLGAHLRQGWRSLHWMAQSGPSMLGALSSNRLALCLGAFAATAAYVVHSAVDFNLHIPANAVLMALVFGILANPGTAQTSAAPGRWSAGVPRLGIALLAAVLLIQCVRLWSGEFYAEKMRTSLRDEDPAAALQFSETALQYEKGNPEIYFYFGRSLLALAHRSQRPEERTHYYERSVAAFEEARRLAPLDGSYPLNLAFIFDEMKRFAEAEEMYALARSRDPHSMTVTQLHQAHLKAWGKNDTEPVLAP